MSDWEEYDEYRYPRRRRIGPRETLPVTGDTVLRAPRRMRDRRQKRRLPCYCLDRCHHQDIGTAPMFRPFAWGPELDDLYTVDLDRTKDDYRIEVLKTQERAFRGSGEYFRHGTCSASSFKKNGHTYYRLKHGDEYQIRMFNDTSEHVNALLKIDSDTMGKWRIGPHSRVTIERPAHNSRKFTFVKESSDAAREGGVRQGENSGSNGLVEVTFIPMIDKRPDSMKHSYPLTNSFDSYGIKNQSFNAMTNSRGLNAEYAKNSVTEADSFGVEESASPSRSAYEAGATVLGEDSNQRFGKASRYFVEDKDRKIVKRVRIVIDNRSKYASIRDRDVDDSGAHDDPVPPKMPFYIS